MLKNRVFYVLLLMTAALIYILTNTYYTLTLLILTVMLPVISLVLMMMAGKKLSIEADVPFAADKSGAVITYRISNAGKLPIARLAFDVLLENRMTDTYNKRKVNASIGSRQNISLDLALKGCKVGLITVNTEKIKIYDAFGLFSRRKNRLGEETIIIYPDIKDVAVQMERPIETDIDGKKYSPYKPGQDVSELFALREYAAGDEIRKIHWKLSTKLDKTVVRDFSLPMNYSLFLLLELTKGSEDLIDAQVETYLSISRALLENGINHNIGWYDAGTEEFRVEELDDFETLEIATARLLSSYTPEESCNALDYYIAGGYRNSRNILIYVVTKPDVEKIAELESSQRMQTILVYEDETIAENAANNIEVTTVSLKDDSEEIAEIIV